MNVWEVVSLPADDLASPSVTNTNNNKPFILQSIHPQHGMTPLHFAANAGHLKVVQCLLAAKANVNAIDEVSMYGWVE